MDLDVIQKKLESIESLPTLPAIAMEVNRMLMDYETPLEELTALLKNDQSIVPRILKLVNSAFFGFRSKVGSISHAIVLLGYNMVRNAIVSLTVIDSLSLKKQFEGFDVVQFWEHAAAVAVTSKHLADMSRIEAREDAFTAGLLHDIGKLIQAQYFASYFRKVWGYVREDQLPYFEAEKMARVIDHCHMGAVLARKWRLPDRLVEVIRRHHTAPVKMRDNELATTVFLANAIVNMYMPFSASFLRRQDKRYILQSLPAAMWETFRTSKTWFAELQGDIEAACKFFIAGE